MLVKFKKPEQYIGRGVWICHKNTVIKRKIVELSIDLRRGWKVEDGKLLDDDSFMYTINGVHLLGLSKVFQQSEVFMTRGEATRDLELRLKHKITMEEISKRMHSNELEALKKAHSKAAQGIEKLERKNKNGLLV